MADVPAALVARAFRVIPGVAYNRTLEELLASPEAAGAKPLVYETVWPPEGAWEVFRDKTYPPFARYMKWRSINPADPRGVLVAIFHREQCYLLEGREFVGLLCELEELTPAALHITIQQWLTS